NGAKAWITNGSVADVAVVWAKVDGTVRGFIVEKSTPGFSTAYHMGKFSLRASVTSQLFFEDCRIPLDNVLPETNGLKYPLSCLTQARYGIAWGALGAAMSVSETARMARDILGANGVSDEYPVIRHMMNLESVKTYEGTHDIHNLIIGEAVTGIAAYNPPMSAKAEKEATERAAAAAAKK